MNEQKDSLPSLFKLSLSLEYQADLLDCCNVFYEQFIKISDNALSDRYRAALYCMVEQGETIADELRKISTQVYKHSPEPDAEPESNTATLRHLDITTTNEKENKHE